MRCWARLLGIIISHCDVIRIIHFPSLLPFALTKKHAHETKKTFAFTLTPAANFRVPSSPHIHVFNENLHRRRVHMGNFHTEQPWDSRSKRSKTQSIHKIHQSVSSHSSKVVLDMWSLKSIFPDTVWIWCKYRVGPRSECYLSLAGVTDTWPRMQQTQLEPWHGPSSLKVLGNRGC